MASINIPLTVDLRDQGVAAHWNKMFESAKRGSKEAADYIKSTMEGDAKFVTTLDFQKGTGAAQVGKVFDKADKDLNKLLNTSAKATKEHNRSLTSLRQQVNTWKQARDGVAKYVNKIRDGKVVGRELNSVWVRNNKHVQISEMRIAKLNGNIMQMARIKFPMIGQLMNMGNALQQIVGIAQAVGMAIQAISAAIAPLINRARQIDAMKLSFEGFGMTAEQANQILDRSKEISLRYGASLTGIEKGFKRITPAILASGGSLEETAMVMESLSARTATLGLNTEQTGRYIEAFAQVMGKGKLQSEELNQQFSELDGSLRAQVAAYLKANHGIDDLEKAMKNGEVTAEIFREAFVEISKEMRDKLAGAIGEVQQRMDELNVQQVENIVNTLNTLTMESLVETFSGLGKSLQRVWVAFSQFFASMATELPALQAIFKAIFDAIGIVVEFTVNTVLAAIIGTLRIFDLLMQKVLEVMQVFSQLPGVAQTLEALGIAAKGFMDGFRGGVDLILGVSGAVNALGTELDKTNGKIMVIQNRLAKGGLGEAEALKLKAELVALQANAELLGQKMENAKLAEQMEEAKEEAKELNNQMKMLKLEAEPLKEEYDKQKEAQQALKKAIQERYEYEIEQSKLVQETIKDQIEQEKERHKSVKEAIAERYDYEKERIDSIYDAKMQSIQSEIDAMGGRTPAEQKLYELRKKEIRQKLNSNQLSKKERLELEAQLERMERQEQIQRKQNELAEEKKKKEEEQKIIQEQKNKKLDEENDKHEKNKKTLDQMLDDAVSKTEKLQEEQKGYMKALDESNEEIKIHIDSLEEIPDLIETQIRRTNDAKDAYFRVQRQIDEVANRIRIAQKEQLTLNNLIDAGIKKQKQLENSKQRSKNMFSGGPVTGGTQYTVNELGQEGFLSASGKLSEINAPAWGQWRAPGAGTVIPAHIWSEMNASGATTAVSSASSNASGVTASGGMMRALRGLRSGSSDRITNNVTIQAANTTQAASDMMVQLNRIRGKRYRS